MKQSGFAGAVVLRPVTTAMVTIALVLFGLVALTRMPVELLPELSYPSITVQTNYADAAHVEVEELVTRPVEEVVGGVPGVVSVESVSREGISEVVLDFAWGTRIDQAMADVREKLDRVRLPLGVEAPIVLRYDPSQEPVLRLALSPDASGGRTDLRALRTIADRHVKRELEKVPGVAAVSLAGGDEEEILIQLDPDRMRALAVDPQEIANAVRADHISRPGGTVYDGNNSYIIRTVHEAKSADELSELIVRSQDGAELRLKDVAQVYRTAAERQESFLVGSAEAVELSVYREGDANIVSVSHAVREAMDHLALDPDLRLVVLSDQSTFIEAAVREVAENTIIGGVLAILVLLFFLRKLRSTMVIAIAIPLSLLTTFIPLRILGVSLNLMSLGGLALGVGMLVDNSIVVLEAIARVRETKEKLSRSAAAVLGSSEVAGSVLASTLTTVAVFFPMAFVEGVSGQLVKDLSYAVSFSLLSSLVVSLTVVPVLESLGGDGEQDPAGTSWPRPGLAYLVAIPALVFSGLRRVVNLAGLGLNVLTRPLVGTYNGLERLYPGLLKLLLRFRVTVLLMTALAGLAALELGSSLGRTLVPEEHQGEFYVQLRLPVGSSLERSDSVARVLARELEQDERVELTFTRVGSLTQGGSAAGSTTGQHLAQIHARLQAAPREQLERAETQLLARLRRSLAEQDIELRSGRPELLSFEAPIEIRIYADELREATAYALRLMPELEEIQALEDIVPDELSGRPEVRVNFNRERLARLGMTIETASMAVQRSIQGELLGKIHASDKQLDIRVQLPRVDRSDRDDVEAIQLGLNEGVAVPLSSVAQVIPGEGPAEIRRLDGRRGLRIRARFTGSDLNEVSSQVERTLAAVEHPESVQAEIGGQAKEMEKSLLSLAFTAALAVFLVYVVMASSFESLHHPFLIMFTVPTAMIGVILGCALLKLPISAMVGIGAIILGGIVVNNAIVLINAVNRRRGQGMEVGAALLEAGRVRIRPIIMTTATTVLGLLPMALGVGQGAALRQPLAVAVIGGLVLATPVTLLVIPCAYALVPGKRREAWREGTE